MKILIEAPFSLQDEARKAIEEKVSTLENYYSKITQANVHFRMDDGQKPDVVLARVQLHVPGPEVFAEETHENFMQAFTAAANKVKAQLIKRKELQTAY